jgi:flagellar hook assembly protein FlgD
MRGEVVRTLVNESKARGAHRAIWDGRNDSGARLASGVYLLRIEHDGQSVTRKLTLLK